MQYVRPVMSAEEAEAAMVTLRAVLRGRLLVEHDADKIRHAIEAIETAPGAPLGKSAPARSGDPETSKQAASKLEPRAGNQRGKILGYYALGRARDGLAAWEAAHVFGLRGCYWKRIGELKDGGWLADTGRTTVNPESGNRQAVLEITDAGRRWVEQSAERGALAVA